MAYTVRIRSADRTIAVEPGQTILEAALGQGVAYPHGCRSGNCGACKSRRHDGEIELAPYSEYALTPAERDGDLILACRATPWSDAEVAWLDADEMIVHPQRFLKCRVAALEQATHDIRIVRLEILSGGPFTFSAGQYARVTFGALAPRDYSMANRPDVALETGGIEFHIRQMTGGTASVYTATTLKVGDTVAVEGPFGTSYLREQHTGPIVAVAGGSGLAPIKSIVETALARGMRQDIALYFGVRDERDLYAEAAMRALAAEHPNFSFTPVLSEPSGATQRRTGFVHEVVGAELGDTDGLKAYLAGPPPMVEAASALLAARGVRREDLHADAFYTEAEKSVLGVTS